jgi:hypothetical protein
MKKLVAPLLIPIAGWIGAPLHAANDAIIEKTLRDIRANADGTFTQTNEVLLRLVTEQGAKGSAQVPIPYSESLQTLEIAEAYTLKPDGTRIDVPMDKIFTQAAPVAVSAPMFNDMKFKIIAFPDPMPGGKLYFRVNLKQTTPHFPNHIGSIEPLLTQLAVENWVMRVSVPAGYSLKTVSHGLQGSKFVDADGRQRWEWVFRNPSAIAGEPYELAPMDHGPMIAFSSFNDWTELARAYRERAADKVKVTAEIQTLADDITKGIADKRGHAAAISQWVARNVRYVAVFLGLGGFVPRDANEILKTKFGDCKDHTVILEALLRAKGIESTGALVHTLPTFKLPDVATIGAFNHIITYIPSLDAYVDSTSAFDRFGVLPGVVSGKPVLHIADGKVAATPSHKAADERVTNKVELTLQADGTIKGKSSVTVAGSYEGNLRQTLNAVPANQKDKFVARWLGASKKGEGKYESSDPSDLTKPLTLTADYEIKDAVSLESPGAFPIPRGFSFVPIHGAVSTSNHNKPRKTPFKCGSDTLNEDVSLTLPAEVKVAALPKDVNYKSASFTFEARYKQEGQTLRVTRKLVRDRTKEFCEPEMWDEVIKTVDIINRDARAQVLIQ